MGVTLADFQLFGLRRYTILPRQRTVTSVDVDALTLSVLGNGWGGPEALQIAAQPGSDSNPALPAGLSAATVYRPLPVTDSDDLIQLSLTVGGAAVEFTDDGAGIFVITEQLGPMIQAYLDTWLSRVEAAMIDYVGPLVDPLPRDVVWCVCKLSAFDFALTQGLVVPSYWTQAKETIALQAADAAKRVEEWRKGESLQGVTDSTPDIDENGAVTLSPDPSATSPWFGSAASAGCI